jgi:hypothetical protein
VAEAVAALSAAELETVRASTRDTLAQFTANDGQIEAPAAAVVAAAVA